MKLPPQPTLAVPSMLLHVLIQGQEADTSNSIASRMSSSGDWASARNCNRTTRPVSHQVKVLDDAPSQSLSQEDEALLSVQPVRPT